MAERVAETVTAVERTLAAGKGCSATCRQWGDEMVEHTIQRGLPLRLAVAPSVLPSRGKIVLFPGVNGTMFVAPAAKAFPWVSHVQNPHPRISSEHTRYAETLQGRPDSPT